MIFVANTSFDWEILFWYYFMIQGHLEGQNVNFKVKMQK